MKEKRAKAAGVIWMWAAAILPSALHARAQDASAPAATPPAAGGAQAAPAANGERLVVRTFYLRSVSIYNDNEVAQALRNIMDPRSKIYYVNSRGAIVVEATPEQIALAEKLVNDLDRPRKGYRITYTVSDVENGKRIGVEHFMVEVVAGQRSVLKQGSKVPIVTGTYEADTSKANSQVTYLDIGMNFDVTLDETEAGVQLKCKVERSSIGEERSGVGPQDPVVRQTSLEGISRVQIGKPLVIGSLDVPGSTRHLEVEALVEHERP